MESLQNGKVRILIAEDSPTQAAQLVHLLERRGYEVTAARNGREALELLPQVNPALVITDVVMPELDGYGFSRAVKELEEWKHVPVILVTTLSDPEDVIRGLECGADNFVRKPYEEKYLLSRIEYLLMNVAMRSNQRIQLGVEITLGNRRHFITSDRQQILDLLISTYEQAVQINDDLNLRKKELSHANLLLAALYRVAEGLNHASTEREVAETVLKRAMEIPGVSGGWILLRNGAEGFRLQASQDLPAAQNPRFLEGGCACVDLCLRGEVREATNIIDCDRLRRAAGSDRSFSGHVAIPLWLHDETLGVMNLIGPEERLFAEDALLLLRSVGNQVAVAMDRARLREGLEQLVEERTRTLEAEIDRREEVERELRGRASREAAAAELGRIAMSATDLPTLLDRACTIVGRTIGAEEATIVELEPGSSGLRICASTNPGMTAGATLPEEEAPQIRFMFAFDVPAMASNIQEEQRFASAARLSEAGIEGMLSAVIAGKDRPFGAITAVTKDFTGDTTADSLFLRAVANMIAEAVARAENEASLNQSRALLHIGSRIGRFGAWTVELPERKLTLSDEVRAIHELPPEVEISTEEAIRFYAPEFRNVISDAFEACLHDGAPFDLELQLTTARGRRVWVRTVGEAERDASGAIHRMNGAFQDISASKAAAEESERLSERLINTLESIGDAFISLDDEWRFTYINWHGEQLFQRPRSELLGKVLWDEFPEAVGSVFEQECRRAVGERIPVVVEEFYALLDIWVEVRAYPFSNGLTLYARDVSAERRAREALEKSEEHFRILTEVAPQMVWMTTAEGSNIYSNQRWVDYTGSTREESQGPGWLKALHPDDEQPRREWRLALDRGEPFESEGRIRKSDGTYRWWLIRALPLKNHSGEITGWMGTGTDIHELKEASRRIAEQAALIDEAHDAILVKDMDHRIVFWSRGAELLYGYGQDAIGRHPDELLRVDEQLSAAATQAVIAEGRWSGELEKLTASDERVTVNSRWTLLRDDRGQPRGILTLDTDITDRRRAELQLQQSEERYRLLFDRNPHPSWVFDQETLRFLAVNEAAVQHYGYSRDEFLGMTIRDIRPPDEVPQLIEVLQGRPDTERPQVFGVFNHRKKDGTVIQAEISSSEIVFSGQRAGLVLAIDVTERRRIEQEYLRAQRTESIGTLAGGIAHDLNNLLMPILMGVSLLKRGEHNERNLRTLENVERSARRGTELVKQVLSFARGVEGSKVSVYLGDVVREVQQIAERTFPKNIRLEHDIQSNLFAVHADPTQLNQVLLNLFVNARDAMPQGGLLTVAARNMEVDEHFAKMHRGLSAGDYVLLEVTDEGVGIPVESLDRIFEPFFTTKEIGRGTGLGLATSAGIVRSHGGSISVYSEPGKGTTFRIFLPGKRSDDAGTSRVKEEDAPLPRGNGELILVADDEPSILAVTEQTLEAYGYRVLVAEDGAQAIGLFATHQSDVALLITDMMMPVMDGPGLIAAARRIKPLLPVIRSSGLDVGGVEAGRGLFLQKPYSADVLLTMVARALSGDVNPH